jgi:hypothetical protein
MAVAVGVAAGETVGVCARKVRKFTEVWVKVMPELAAWSVAPWQSWDWSFAEENVARFAGSYQRPRQRYQWARWAQK